MRSLKFPLVLSVISAAFLTACGEAEVKKVAAAPVDRGVFTSTSDCVESGKLTEEACGQAIDRAVVAHNAQSPVYKSRRLCENAEGPDRCDKTGEGRYRARVQAFYVTMSKPPTAVALYPPISSNAAFRSPSKQELSVNDESLNMSSSAMSVANENARLPKRSESAEGGGATATDIR